jgi:uncharacterized protein (UPF0264 family)
MIQKSRSLAALAISAVALVAFSRVSLAQTPVKSGFNVFSADQDATNDLANELIRANPHLRAVSGSMKRQTIDNARAVSVVLAGRSPVTRADERVTVFTRELPDGHVLYALFVAPAQDYSALSRTFQSMVSSLHVNDQSAHSEHAH